MASAGAAMTAPCTNAFDLALDRGINPISITWFDLVSYMRIMDRFGHMNSLQRNLITALAHNYGWRGRIHI